MNVTESSAYHCEGIAKGAISDPQAGPRVQRLARMAVHEALAGIQTDSLSSAHRDAASVIKTLDAAESAWPK